LWLCFRIQGATEEKYSLQNFSSRILNKHQLAADLGGCLPIRFKLELT